MSVPTNITREYDHLHWWPHLLEEHLEQGKKQPGQFYRGNMVQQTHGLTVDTKARVTLLVATLDTRWCQLHLLQRVCDGFCAPIFAFPKLKFGFYYPPSPPTPPYGERPDFLQAFFRTPSLRINIEGGCQKPFSGIRP